MKRLQNSTKLIFLLVAVFLLFPRNVYAYLDPGTGSLIAQTIIAAFFVVSLAIKVYWRKMKVLISSLHTKSPAAKQGK